MSKKEKKSKKTLAASKKAKKNLKPAIDYNTNQFNQSFGQYAGWIVLGLIAVVGVLLLSDYLFFKKVYLFKGIASDSINSYYPSFVHLVDYLKTDGWPRWSFGQGLGQNIGGSLNSPFRAILYIVGVGNIAYSLAWIEFLKMLIGGFLFFYYLRTIKFSAYTCIIGGLIFAFSGYLIVGGSGWYGHSEKAVFGVLWLLGFEKIFKENKAYYFPLGVMLMSVSFFHTYMYTLGLAVYAMARFYAEKGTNVKELGLLTAKMVGAGALGIMLNSISFIHPLNQVLNSPRGSGSVDVSVNPLQDFPMFGFETKLHYATTLMRSFSNDLLGNGTKYAGWYNYLEAPIFYIGILTLILLPLAFIFFTKREKIAYGALIAFWALIVAFPFFRYSILLYAGDYYKQGISFLLPVTMLFIGMRGLDYIDSWDHKKKAFPIKFSYFIGGITFLLLCFLMYPYDFKAMFNADTGQTVPFNPLNTGMRNIIAFFLLAHAALLFLMSRQAFKYMAQVALLVLVCLELLYISYPTINRDTAMTAKEVEGRVGYNDYSKESIDFIKAKDKGFYRITKEYSSGISMHGSVNDAKVMGYKSTPSYGSFNPKRFVKFYAETECLNPKKETSTRWVMGLQQRGRPLLESLICVKYKLMKKRKPDEKLNPNFGYKQIYSHQDVTAFQNSFALPLGVTYDKIVPYEAYLQLKENPPANKNVRHIPKDVSMLRGAVVEADLVTAEVNSLPKVDMTAINTSYNSNDYLKDVNDRKADTLSISYYDNNHIEGTINLEKPKLLFLAFPFDEGWHATVNGENAQLMEVNHGLTGLMLPAGSHTIKMEFVLPYQTLGLVGTLIALGLYLFLLFFSKRKKKGVE